MTKSQLDNLIDFCFNFHETMGVNMDGCSADYILEKWHKYIGVDPYKNETLDIDVLNEEMKNIRKYKFRSGLWQGLPCGIGREDVRRMEALLEWSNKWGNYHEIKEILYFITIVNSKGFTPDEICWTPSQLIETFSEWIGNPEKINFQSYRHLHSNVEREIKEWLATTSVNRDYKLCSLI